MRKSGSRSAKSVPQQVRIIGGQWKRTPLPVVDAEGLRPTPDRVRETVFNWLNHLLDGAWEGVACLDLFAGTGALGFEAASRGAAQVIMVESHAPAARQLEANATKLQARQIRVMRGDALVVLQNLVNQHASFDLIFADPPYHHQWLDRVAPLCERLLRNGGLLYAEAEVPLDSGGAPPWMENWEVIRSGKAGMVHFHLLRRKSGA
jgi:16S rRNA (guanine(966)-N(2))-methyltransferase RsmD